MTPNPHCSAAFQEQAAWRQCALRGVSVERGFLCVGTPTVAYGSHLVLLNKDR